MGNPKENMAVLLRQNRWHSVGQNDRKHDLWEREVRGGGGEWQLALDYHDPEWSWRTDRTTNRLIAAVVKFIVRGEEQVIYGGEYGGSKQKFKGMTLHRPDGHGGYNSGETWIWKVTGRNPSGSTWVSEAGRERILRARAELVVKNPDLVAWLVSEGWHKARLDEAVRRAQAILEQAERDKPLPVTISQAKESRWADSEWDKAVERVEIAVRKVKRADGTSDLRALVRELKIASATIINAVIPDEAPPPEIVRVRPRVLDLE